MTREEFLAMVHAARADWEATLARIPEERLTEPGLAGGWSAKDTIAHVTWSEREMVGVIRERALVGSPLWALGQDERNAAVYAENRDRPLDEVLAKARAVWAELLPGLESLSDEDLNDPSRFRELAESFPGVLPWQIFAGSTFKHYGEHAADLRAWLDGGERSGA
jgi:uncharacterized damage-inducible protein DinB